jgi:hypothetical protein
MQRALAALVAVVTLAIPAQALAAPASLPPVKQTLGTAAAADRSCATRARPGARGVALARYTAPMSGFVTTRLAAPDSSDWDLGVFDAASGLRMAASEAFGSHEVTQTWVSAGQRLLVQGCHRSGTARKAGVSLTFFDITPPSSSGLASLVRVKVRDQADPARLEAMGFDVTHNQMVGQADVIVHGNRQLDLLRNTGLKLSTLIPDLTQDSARARAADMSVAAAGTPSPLPTGRNTYRVLTDYQNELKAIVKDYGPAGLAKPVVIGKTVEGRSIEGVELSKNVNGSDDGRPTYVVIGMHHAREWPSAEAAMEFAWLLAKGYGSDPQVTSLLERERVVVIPIDNVDGFVVSRTDSQFSPNDQLPSNPMSGNIHLVEAVAPGGPPAAYRRKNCAGSFPTGAPCELQYGVDPNRNYGQGWGGFGASSEPSSQTYRGQDPWSEPETKSFWKFSQKRNITAMITLHNVAALVLRPPGRKSDGFAPDEPMLKKLGDAMADATGYTSQFGWQLYDTSGTTEDWNYAAQGALGYTIEIGPEGGQFHMPYETGVIKEWVGTDGRAGLRGALLIAAEAAADPVNHAVIKGTAPAGRVLRLHKSFKTSTSPICTIANPSITSNICEGTGGRQLKKPDPPKLIDDQLDYTTTVPVSGSYSWMVGPSTRPFVGSKWEMGKQVKVGEQKWDNTMPVDGSNAEIPFKIDRADLFRTTIDLTWDPQCATDLDLEVYWKDPVINKWRKVASSGNPAGSCEQATLIQPRTGDYKAVVVLFASAPATPYHLVNTHYVGDIKVTPGTTEAYTMTCETPDGKVLETKDVTVGRGETAAVDFACGSAAGPANGRTEGQVVQGVKQRGGSRSKLSKRAACLKRASHIKSKRGRAKAIKRCKGMHPGGKKHVKVKHHKK